jgi:CheY-like chemotaxis protein
MSASEKKSGDRIFKILIVDDEPQVRRSIKLLLQYDGHEVTEVENGKLALARLAEQKFDLVITDYFMPEMRGDALIKHIRSQSPELPVLMISAHGSQIGQGKIDADVMLGKPFSRSDLQGAVGQAMCRNQTESRSQS